MSEIWQRNTQIQFFLYAFSSPAFASSVPKSGDYSVFRDLQSVEPRKKKSKADVSLGL